MFDDKYVEFDDAVKHCEELGARLPVLDSAETIEIIKTCLETSNFTVFEVFKMLLNFYPRWYVRTTRV
jgi:hypothetical protein